MDIAGVADEQLVFESEHLRVFFRDAPTNTVVVTFSSLGFAPGKENFWGGALLEKLGIAAVGFAAVRPNWFPIAGMPAALAAARACIRSRRVVTYGHSQGGYGALKFGAELGASLALAFSPQWSINPADSAEFDDRFARFHMPALQNGERVEPGDVGPRNLIFIDPAIAQDRAHAERMAGFRRTEIVPMPFIGHETIRLIEEAGISRQLMNLALAEDDPPAAAFRRLIRDGRSGSATYTERRLDRLQTTISRHRRMYAHAVDALPQGDDRTIARLLGHLGLGQTEEADRLLASVPDERLGKRDLLKLAGAFRRLGYDAGEKRIAPLFKRKYANDVILRLYGANCLARQGMIEEAKAELAELAARPEAGRHAFFFIETYNLLDRLDDVLVFFDRLLEAGQMELAERLKLGSQVIMAYRLRKRPNEAVREVITQARLVGEDGLLLLKLVNQAFELGASSLAQDLVVKLSRLPDAPPLWKVYQAHLDMRAGVSTARAQLAELGHATHEDLPYWEKLADLASRAGDHETALAAAQKAFAISAETNANRWRLAQVLAAAGNRRLALVHLKFLLGAGGAESGLAELMAELAAKCRDLDLAVQFARRRISVAPKHGQMHLLLCRLLREWGKPDQLRAAIEALIRQLERGLTMNRQQLCEALDFARDVGHGLDASVARVALRAFPGDPEFLGFAQTGLFGEAGGLAGTAPIPAPRRNGFIPKLLSRLRLASGPFA